MVRESFNNPNQVKLNLQPTPETEAERIHRLGKEDHFEDIRKRYNIPPDSKISYGYKTSIHKQILIDGQPLEKWYKEYNLKNKNNIH